MQVMATTSTWRRQRLDDGDGGGDVENPSLLLFLRLLSAFCAL
jgi:hypothetical protein